MVMDGSGHEKIWLHKNGSHKTWSQMDVVVQKLVLNTMVKFPMKITRNSWLHEMDEGNLLMGKFLEAMVTTPLCGVSL